ncbi:hypothetical protein JCM5350_001572 [Sporobolomyces pararoseus]
MKILARLSLIQQLATIMLRTTRLLKLQHLRSIHTTRTRFERLPTFTTPTPTPPSPQSPPPTTPTTSNESLSPLPPTNLPVEDYASPLLHTASFFSTLFRYSVYSSVGIVSLAITSLVGIHLYVEHVALASPSESDEDVEEWLEEGSQGWSGKHLKKGTDPKLGVLARSAIRGAWICLNWNPNSGTAASPLSTTQTTAIQTSRFGPRMIGQEEYKKSIRGGGNEIVADSGWLLAEQYLSFALKKASEKGFSLLEPSDWESRIEKGGVDRSLVELEERLAGLRERLGGRLKLELAREGWERIYQSLNQSPSTDLTTEQGRKLIEWEEREKLLASRKLGELGIRIAEFSGGKDSEEGKIEFERSKEWFLRGLQPILSQQQQQPSSHLSVLKLEPSKVEKHVSPKSSFFSFWSRSHPSTTTITTTSSSSSSSSDLSTLSQLIESTSPESFPPSTSRAILSSLVSLETFLARSLSDLNSAQQIQKSSIQFAQRLSSSNSNSDSTTTSESTLARKDLNQISKLLSSLYLKTRLALLETHLQECKLASLGGSKNLKKKLKDFETGLKEFKLIQHKIQSVLQILPPSSSSENEELLFTREVVGVGKESKKILEETSRKIRRDAEKIETINQGLINFLEQQQQQQK